MADLKSGTTVGGASIWNASNLRFTPLGELLTYRGYKVYTSNDKPSAEDVGALSLLNGGSIKGVVTSINDITTTKGMKASTVDATTRMSISRGDFGIAPVLHMVKTDMFTSDSLPASNTQLGAVVYREGSKTSDPLAGIIRGNVSSHVLPTGGSILYLDARDISGVIKNRISLDTDSGTTSISIGSFKAGVSTLGDLTGTTANFSGAVGAASFAPLSFGNFDSRYMSGLLKRIPSGITSLADPSITEKNDVWTVADTFTDGPSGNAIYAGMLVNYRRALAGGSSLIQVLYTLDTTYTRIASGSSGSWTWRGGDANGWRKVFDSANLPTSVDLNALPTSGGTITGDLTVSGTTTFNGNVNATLGFNVASLVASQGITSNTVITSKGGAVETLSDDNSYYWFRKADGTEKAVIWTGVDNVLRMRSTANKLSLEGMTLNTSAPIVSTGAITTTGTVTAGVVATGGTTKYTGGLIYGVQNAKIFADHGNGNVTLSASLTSNAASSGVLYIGYDSRANGHYTDSVSIERPVIAKYNINAAGRVQGSDLLAGGNVYSGGGNSYMTTDGNLVGSAWTSGNNVLSAHIYNVANERASAWANQQVNAIIYSQSVWTAGTYLMGIFMPSAWIGLGTLVNGSDLRPATTAGDYDPNTGFPGTYMCCGRSVPNQRVTIWKRVA